jgi:hypothetical protein
LIIALLLKEVEGAMGEVSIGLDLEIPLTAVDVRQESQLPGAATRTLNGGLDRLPLDMILRHSEAIALVQPLEKRVEGGNELPKEGPQMIVNGGSAIGTRAREEFLEDHPGMIV